MKFALITALGVAVAATTLPAAAQTYQWKDATGRTVISDTPPPPSIKGSRAIAGERALPTTEKPVDKDAGAAKSQADKDLEAKKLKQDEKTKAEQKAKEEARVKETQEFCEKMRGNVAALESSQRLTTPSADGTLQYIDTDQRQLELERITRQLDEHCK